MISDEMIDSLRRLEPLQPPPGRTINEIMQDILDNRQECRRVDDEWNKLKNRRRELVNELHAHGLRLASDFWSDE